MTPKAASGRDTHRAGVEMASGAWRHWEHKHSFEVAREKSALAEQLAKKVGKRPATRAN